MRTTLASLLLLLSVSALLVNCGNAKTDTPLVASKSTFNGFDSQVQWGEHIITVSGCHDCHSPKKMTAMGMELDSSHLLAGYTSDSHKPDINAKELQAKGLTVTGDLTSWVGPWGTTYTANLTSDATGIGNWTEGQFMKALREGKYKGMASSRDLLPPMPWQMYRHFTDDEIKALFAYLKSTAPVKNVVPPPLPPAAR